MFKSNTPSTVPSIAQIPFDSDCAWCWGAKGKKPKTGSHGICPPHETIMYAQIEAVKAARKARKQQ